MRCAASHSLVHPTVLVQVTPARLHGWPTKQTVEVDVEVDVDFGFDVVWRGVGVLVAAR